MPCAESLQRIGAAKQGAGFRVLVVSLNAMTVCVKATFAVSACVDGLCATRARAEVVEISLPPDTDAAWQIRGLNRLSSWQVAVYPVLPGAAR